MTVAVPFPTEATVDLAPPSAEEVILITRGLATGAAGPNGLTDTQRAVLNALTTSMTGITVDVAKRRAARAGRTRRRPALPQP